ncbi:MAG: PorV/PorQ family protein [Edaphocola sp.]
MKQVLLGVFAMAGAASLHAQSRIYVNEYLNIGVGARSLGMAGATAASVSDVYAGYWNPAGLIHMDADVQAGAMHAEYFAGIFNYDYGSLAIPLKGKNRALGISFIRFATDNIPYTLDYVQPDGSFDESKLKGFSAGDYAALLTYSQKLNFLKKHPEWETSIGANAKVLYRNVGSMANAWGFGLDIGLQARYKSWKFGLGMKDITTSYTAWSFHLTEHEKEVFSGTGNELPIKSYEVMLPRFNFGVAHSFIKPEKNIQLLAEIGFDITTDGKRNTLLAGNTISVDPRMGLEASYKNTLFLRAGVGNFYSALDNADTNNVKKYTVFQPSVGVGFKVKSFSIDYAFTSLQMQENPLMSHIVSIRLDIMKAGKTKDADPKPAMPVKATQPPSDKNK